MYIVKKRTVIKNRLRFTMFIIAAAVVVNTAVFAFLLPGQTSADISHKTQSVYAVPGDTLWEIASKYTAEGSDMRETIYKIKKLNNMVTADLIAGQEIIVPLN